MTLLERAAPATKLRSGMVVEDREKFLKSLSPATRLYSARDYTELREALEACIDEMVEKERAVKGYDMGSDAPFLLGLVNGRMRSLAVSVADLTFSTYQDGAAKTAIYPGRRSVMGLVYAALGLGEAGELQNKVKKVLRDSNGVVTPEKLAAITQELGDLLWYVSAVCDELGVSMEQVARANLFKLADRMDRGVIKGDGDKR